MSVEEFRRYGYQLIDWLADYQTSVEHYPVLSQANPGELREQLPPSMPSSGESFDDILADFEKLIVPGITHWQSPNFFAFFPANNSAPSILGELLSAGLGVQGMLWVTSPACTELETHVLDWVAEALDLPSGFRSNSDGGGVIQDSASSATLCALLTARERATRFRAKEQGVDGRLVMYASDQAHSSIDKAAAIAGIGRSRLHKISVDEQFRLRPDVLRSAIARDRADGLIPFFVNACVGTTSTLAVDPVEEIGEICRQERLWLHVDAAMAGTASICPEFRYLNAGLDYADSYCFNPHKWMFTNFDCDCFYVADRFELISTMSILPEYLRNRATDSGEVIDYRDWQIPLGRRFRALKLWFVLRHYGLEGLRYHIRQHVEWSKQLVEIIDSDPDYEIATPPMLNLVCFRHRSDEDTNRRLLDEINRRGNIYLSHTTTNGQFCIRFCVGQTNTSWRHVENAWGEIKTVAEIVTSEKGSEP